MQCHCKYTNHKKMIMTNLVCLDKNIHFPQSVTYGNQDNLCLMMFNYGVISSMMFNYGVISLMMFNYRVISLIMFNFRVISLMIFNYRVISLMMFNYRVISLMISGKDCSLFKRKTFELCMSRSILYLLF